MAYLAVENNRPHPREVLAELLWPDRPMGFATGNLRWVVHNLRELFKNQVTTQNDQNIQFLQIHRDFIRLNLSDEIWVDVIHFCSLLKTEPHKNLVVARVQQAIELYRGNFLEGFSVKNSAPFEEWILLHRERLSIQYLQALYHLSNHHASLGEFEIAEEYAWRQLELEPWKEEAHQQLMGCLAASGQRSEALAQFEVCRRTLQDGLGVEPSHETIHLYQLICQDELKLYPVNH